MKTLPVAVQVYSVRDDAERDFKGTMQKIKDMGYDGVELAGLYGMKPAEVKAILEEVGLVPLSAHVPFQELEADIEGTVAQYKDRHAVHCHPVSDGRRSSGHREVPQEH